MPDQPQAYQREEEGGVRKRQAVSAKEPDTIAEQSAPYRPNPRLKRVERGFESLIFNSRWLMAPFYFGLVVSLAVLMLKFCMLLWEFILHAPGSKESDWRRASHAAGGVLVGYLASAVIQGLLGLASIVAFVFAIS